MVSICPRSVYTIAIKIGITAISRCGGRNVWVIDTLCCEAFVPLLCNLYIMALDTSKDFLLIEIYFSIRLLCIIPSLIPFLNYSAQCIKSLNIEIFVALSSAVFLLYLHLSG